MDEGDRHVLRWTPNRNPPVILPPHPLPSNAPRKRALFFVHGAFGCAFVWLHFMTYFSQTHGHPCYALSLRGHGESWKPTVLRMVFLLGKKELALDLIQGLSWAKAYEAGTRGIVQGYDDIVLVGHSAGGGLAQYFVGEGMGRVGALCMVGSWPPFDGVKAVPLSLKIEPRPLLRDIGHPRLLFSSTTRVHHAFFSPPFPRDEVRQFETIMTEIESWVWPSSMLGRFVNVTGVLRNICGWNLEKGERLLVISGDRDALVGTELPQTTANAYRRAWRELTKDGVIEGKEVEARTEKIRGNNVVEMCDGVRRVVIAGAGHHIQNDVQWEETAVEILIFVEQL